MHLLFADIFINISFRVEREGPHHDRVVHGGGGGSGGVASNACRSEGGPS